MDKFAFIAGIISGVYLVSFIVFVWARANPLWRVVAAALILQTCARQFPLYNPVPDFKAAMRLNNYEDWLDYIKQNQV